MKLSIKAHTKSKRVAITGPNEEGVYDIYVNTPPVDGRANKAICLLLAKHFDVPPSTVTVIRGLTSQRKIVEIEC